MEHQKLKYRQLKVAYAVTTMQVGRDSDGKLPHYNTAIKKIIINPEIKGFELEERFSMSYRDQPSQYKSPQKLNTQQ